MPRRRWPTRGLERLELQSAELARQLQSQRRLLEINERLLSTLERAEVLETIADGLKAVVRTTTCRSTASTRCSRRWCRR